LLLRSAGESAVRLLCASDCDRAPVGASVLAFWLERGADGVRVVTGEASRFGRCVRAGAGAGAGAGSGTAGATDSLDEAPPDGLSSITASVASTALPPAGVAAGLDAEGRSVAAGAACLDEARKAPAPAAPTRARMARTPTASLLLNIEHSSQMPVSARAVPVGVQSLSA
jgi:hypothetical protein